MRIFLLPLLALCIHACNPSKGESALNKGNTPSKPAFNSTTLPAGFQDYWYKGQAEICTYDVLQDRYDEIRKADEVHVFVTEDLSKKKQVKLDDPAQAGSDRSPVLKLNTIRRFHTGIYDYSLMESVFTPVDGSPTLKTSTTVQDWCGHVFAQTNLGTNGYNVHSYSYFEMEGDREFQLPLHMLEDELWVRLRLNPESIPVGETQIIPSTIYCRLRHKPYQPEKATISFSDEGKSRVLKVQYTNIPRTLAIRFERTFPFRILGWEETNNNKNASSGTLKSTTIAPYWTQHDHASDHLRDSLKLYF
jgi:hypothetical protein